MAYRVEITKSAETQLEALKRSPIGSRLGWTVSCGARGLAFRQKYEVEMRDRFDTHFYVGTINQHPSEWIVVGLFYPPKVPPKLF